jgi:hypothetical protein
MRTVFLTISITWQGIPDALPDVIEARLRQYGEPLRWAITQVEVANGESGARVAQVEAVVTV